jgi:hypothetical protein
MRLDSPTRDHVNSTFSYPSLPRKCLLLFIIASRTSAYSAIMGRTVPSFRIVLAEEKQEWASFKKALDKSERKIFDEMWDVPRLYVSACSNSVQLVPLQPIIISILFHHYKELNECIAEVEGIETKSTIIAKQKYR